MRKLNDKLKYKFVTDGAGNSHAEIWGVRKDTGKKALFGTCHVESIQYLKQDFKKNIHLVNFNGV